MQQINVAPEKAAHLQELAKLSPKALAKLADKLKHANEKRIAEIEKKIHSYAMFI